MTMEREEQLVELASRPVGWLIRCYVTEGRSVPEGLIEALTKDRRSGARQLALRLQSRLAAHQAEGARLQDLLCFENQLREQGYRMIAGVDEAGVGPLAGPVVAAAVILPDTHHLHGLDDSKRLTKARRKDLAEQIRSVAISWALGISTVEEIDQLNIYQAGLQAMLRAVNSLSICPDHLLIDARTIQSCPVPQQGIVRGDALSASIAAASIIAKTTRDAIMADLDREYPGYGLAIHKGYPTPAHLEAIKKLGVLPIHRRSFRPVRIALGLAPDEPEQTALFG
jgi:ribonuclease HII